MPKFIFSLVFLFASSLLWSQGDQQEALQKRKEEILKEINEKERELKKIKSKEKSVQTQLKLQNEKINLKEKLINTTAKQTRILSDNIYTNQLAINKLNRELEVLKEDYANMILKSYKSRSEQSRAMFLLSSKNFLQAYKRAQYMKQYASYRKTQGQEIGNKTKELIAYNEKISVQKEEKQKLIEENEKEKITLLKEKQEKQQIANAIAKDKKQIVAEINKKQKESKAIDAKINKLIKEAIAASNKKTAKAKPATTASTSSSKATTKAVESTNKIILTAESKIVSDNFKSNKGKLPWPVEKGFVSLGYGDQPHPVYKSLIVHNSGVEITTDQGAQARAVFGGEVVSVMVLSPVNKAVMIQHGDYFTVYQNLSSVSVSKGDKVTIKQKLGTIRTNGDTKKTVLKFTISQNTIYNNPATWLFNM
ncbi:MAG TPA: peptidoglycan DD-metalloendopeptidase family protein [Flavobacterium sp.]|nr:peptidoglycan DD-metalloendopeptidase family protein [Flavobacterium sp.]